MIEDDDNRRRTIANGKRKKDSKKHVGFRVSRALYANFKSATARRGRSMQDTIETLMQNFVRETTKQ